MQRLQSLRTALLTPPPRRTLWPCLGIGLVYLALALPLGLLTGFGQLEPLALSLFGLLRLVITLLVVPSLLEELFFRALLLPHPQEGASWQRAGSWTAVSLLLYLLWHPLNARLFRVETLALFSNLTFLLFTLLLGLACSGLYLVSGSLWPPVALHWLTVLLWITLLGGAALLP